MRLDRGSCLCLFLALETGSLILQGLEIPPSKMELGGEGGGLGIPFVVPFLFWGGRLATWNWGAPTPLPLKVGGMV